jgi:hypothetical protein
LGYLEWYSRVWLKTDTWNSYLYVPSGQGSIMGSSKR